MRWLSMRSILSRKSLELCARLLALDAESALAAERAVQALRRPWPTMKRQ